MTATIAVLGALASSGCVDAPTGEPSRIFPQAIELASAPNQANRHFYEITGPKWETPHRLVGEHVFTAPPRPRVELGEFEAITNEPAPYTRATPVLIRTRLGAAFAPERDMDIEWSVVGTLRSRTAPDLEPIEILRESGVAERRDSVEPTIELLTEELPSRVDVWDLELAWQFTSMVDDEEVGGAGSTTLVIPTLLADPVPDAPLYKQAVLWSSEWAAGDWDVDDPQTKHQIAERLTMGVRSLENQGRSYGAFPRPPRNLIEDRVDIFLDFERSACGEYRGVLMGLIEYHGIDASWVWFRFPEPDDDYFDPTENTHYRTRTITAVGRSARQWSYSNHIVVSVDGRIYDPTHTVIKDSWEEYEDWMFADYCRKDGEDLDCRTNPPGYVADDGIHPRVIFADNYK